MSEPAVFPKHHLPKSSVDVDANHPSHLHLLPEHMTGAAGDTTTTDSRSQRNRASRRGGQLLTRALSSSYASACPHIVLPVPLSRWSHHTPRCRKPQRNVGTETSHTGYEPGGLTAANHPSVDEIVGLHRERQGRSTVDDQS